MMKLFIFLTLAVVATTTAYVQAADERPTEFLDGVKILSDIATDKKSQYVVDNDNDYDHHYDHDYHHLFAHPEDY